MYDAINRETTSTYSFRPIVTLNSTVKIDAENSGDGTQPENAWILKNE